MRLGVLILCLAAALAGCRVGPNYHRPNVHPPPQFRDGEPNPTQASLGNVKWFDLFQDDVLRGLIKQALVANYDILIAAQRVIAAQGQFIATRSTLYPRLDGESSVSRSNIAAPVQSQSDVLAILSWEADLFGRLRRATEAARADALAAEENQETVIQTLIAQVASAYFNLRELDAELEIVRESIKFRQESVALTTAREQGGVASMVDVDMATSLVQTAQSDAIVLEKTRTETENLISFLLGRPPGPVARGLSLVDQPQPAEVPAGLPSSLLERRPDLRAAEQEMVAANARVGVAKAAYFPSLNLTAAGGAQTSDLARVANGGAYSALGILDVPIVDFGRRRGNYQTAKADSQAFVLNYLNVANGAFRDVSNALIDHQKSKEFAASQKALTDTLRDQTRLANARYAGGATSYLEVLDSERQRLTAEQLLVRARRDVLIALVQLYQALGGGWQ